MKRGKKAEEAAADGENDTGSGNYIMHWYEHLNTYCSLHIKQLSNRFSELKHVTCHFHELKCFVTSASAKKAKATKEPEAPILYDDPPDKMTSKDGRNANMKITSWNVDGLRAWVKKKGLDVSLQ